MWWIYAVTEAGTRLWGAYLVFALASAYAFAALVDLFGNMLGGAAGSGSS